jgi:hypothetical protein
MAGIARMVFFENHLLHHLHVSRLNQAVARPHLSEELEAMNVNDLVVTEGESLGKHLRGDLEQFGLE